MDQIQLIILKYIREEDLSWEERAELKHWLDSAKSGEREKLLNQFKDKDWLEKNLLRFQSGDVSGPWTMLEETLTKKGIWQDEGESKVVKSTNRQYGQYSRRSMTAAILIMLTLAGGAFWYLYHPGDKKVNSAVQALVSAGQPGGIKALLTLSDGRQINLDSSTNGTVANQGNIKISKLASGQLSYHVINDKPVAPAYNTLSTPRAGQFTLYLPDGTKVWLNNASSMRYPVYFCGNNRSVELTGEAYFEVTKNPSMPFRVIVNHGNIREKRNFTIEVLGTSFNVMAYLDEEKEKTTLVEGSVRIVVGHKTSNVNGGDTGTDSEHHHPGSTLGAPSYQQTNMEDRQSNVILQPGQQALIVVGFKTDNGSRPIIGSWIPNSGIQVLDHVNVQEVTAWKNGYFHFDHSNLETTMRQLARWYDVDVEYKAGLSKQSFIGKVQRSLPLTTVLKGLENDHLHFKLEGRRLLILP